MYIYVCVYIYWFLQPQLFDKIISGGAVFSKDKSYIRDDLI